MIPKSQWLKTMNVCLLLSFYVHCRSAAVLTYIFFVVRPTLTDKPLAETWTLVIREKKESMAKHMLTSNLSPGSNMSSADISSTILYKKRHQISWIIKNLSQPTLIIKYLVLLPCHIQIYLPYPQGRKPQVPHSPCFELKVQDLWTIYVHHYIRSR